MNKRYYNRQDKDHILRLAQEQFPFVFFTYAGGDYPHVNDTGEFRRSCPLCDSSSAAFVWKGHRFWTCYRCGAYGTPFRFVMDMLGCDCNKAAELLAELLCYQSTAQPEFIPPVVIKNPEPFQLLKETELDYCRGMHPYWQRIPEEVRAYLDGGYCDERWHALYGRITFPVRDDEGRLVGITGRCTGPKPPANASKWIQERWDTPEPPAEGEDWRRKYSHFGAEKIDKKTGRPLGGFRRGRVLYNLHNAKLYNTMPLLLVEGPFDVARAIQYGYHAAAALQGSIVTVEQWKLIKQYFTRVICALDPDIYQLTAKEQILNPNKETKFHKFAKQAKTWEMDIAVMRMPEGIDVGDASEEVFLEALWHALQ